MELAPEPGDEGEEHMLRGVRFSDLPEINRRRFMDYGIDVKVVNCDVDDDQVFEMYEDINSGSEDLKTQQLRRAAYPGPYLQLIERLRNDEHF